MQAGVLEKLSLTHDNAYKALHKRLIAIVTFVAFSAFLASQANNLKAKTSWVTYLEDFLLTGRIEGKKAKTLQWYKEILTPFVCYTDQQGLDQFTLRRYINNLYDRLKITSVDTHVRAIKTFLNFLHREGYLEENFASVLKRPRLPKQFPYVLNDEQIANLLKTPDKRTWEGFRNYVILLTFLDTGIRLSELLTLTLDRVNLTRGSMVVIGKGEKEREVYMGRTLKKAMAKWLKMRGFHPYEDRVFITRDGRPLKKRGVEQIIERLSKKAGIVGVRCSPHTLRHTFATNFIRNGGDVFTLQRILGHSNIETCMIYVHMGGKQIREAMLKYSPIDRLG